MSNILGSLQSFLGLALLLSALDNKILPSSIKLRLRYHQFDDCEGCRDMTRLRLTVLVIGSMFIVFGALGLIQHIWVDYINIGFIVWGAFTGLLTLITTLPSKEPDTLLSTHRVNRASILAPRRPTYRENTSYSRYTRPGASRRFTQNYSFLDTIRNISRIKWIWIVIILISLIIILLVALGSSPTTAPTANTFIFNPLNPNNYSPPSTAVYTVVWSPNGKYIATAGSDHKVRVWDVTNKSIIETYSGHQTTVNALAWSHDGTRVASADSTGIVKVWDAANGHTDVTYTGHSGAVTALAWSPNDVRIASASDDMTVNVWDVIDGTTVYTYRGHHKPVTSVAWSHNGTRIVSGASGDKNEIQVWDATTGANVVTYSNPEAYSTVDAVAWSPDDTRIASSGDNTVRIWDAATGGKTVSVICSGHQNTDTVDTVAWSPDGTYVASGGYDNTVTICDSATGNTTLTYQDKSGSVYSLDWSPDGKRIASASDDGVQIWDVANGKRLFTLHS